MDNAGADYPFRTQPRLPSHVMTDLDKYDYKLPTELIAQQPLTNRADSRLMVINRAEGSIEHFHFRDLPSFLHPTDALVLNNTLVLRAKLAGYRLSTGGRWQGLYLESDERNVWIRGQTRVNAVESEKREKNSIKNRTHDFI